MTVTDEPHENYTTSHPFYDKLSHGVPVLHNSPKGMVLKKNVIHHVLTCPECDTERRIHYDEDEDPVCKGCGLIVGGEKAALERIVIDEAAAERMK